MTAESYYHQLSPGRFESTIHAQGAWNPHEQHMAPATGILAHCLAAHEPRDGMRIARLSFDILGLIPGGEFTVETTTIRPGRTIELVQAEFKAQGRTAIRGTAWRLMQADTTAVAAIEDEPMPGPDELGPSQQGMGGWPGGYIASLDFRQVPGHRPGRGQVWIHTEHPVLDGIHSSDFVRLMGLVDTSNGIAARVSPGPGSYMFPNVDLQIHLYREPTGEWLGLDNRVTFGADAIGLTSSVLHDVDGPFGRAEQILTVRPTPDADSGTAGTTSKSSSTKSSSASA